MERDYEMEIVRRLFDNTNQGAYISVGPSADFPDNVMLYTDTPANKEMFGDLRLDLPWAMMKLVGEALIACAMERKAAEEGK